MRLQEIEVRIDGVLSGAERATGSVVIIDVAPGFHDRGMVLARGATKIAGSTTNKYFFRDDEKKDCRVIFCSGPLRVAKNLPPQRPCHRCERDVLDTVTPTLSSMTATSLRPALTDCGVYSRRRQARLHEVLTDHSDEVKNVVSIGHAFCRKD